jgi:transposase
MEACTGAHEWARRFQRFGHDVRLIAPKFIAAYRRGEKSDGNDAEAICEAVSRPQMRFVPIKSLDQQAELTLHRVRQGFVTERTTTVNRIRGLLAEFGFVVPQRTVEIRRQVPKLIEQLPALARRGIADLHGHLLELERRIREYDACIAEQSNGNDAVQRLMKRPGVGILTTSAIVATVGNARDFRNGRQFAAWLGLVPRQYSTGGKTRLGRITKRGDTYLRTLLVLGARTVLRTARKHTDGIHRWAASASERRGWHRAAVALAAKNARAIWALLARPPAELSAVG